MILSVTIEGFLFTQICYSINVNVKDDTVGQWEESDGSSGIQMRSRLLS